MAERTVVHDTIVTERTYDRPPDRVFAAWRDPVTKRKWFAEGEGWLVEEYGLDCRVGGREHGRFRRGNGPDGPSSRKQGWNGLLERLAAALA